MLGELLPSDNNREYQNININDIFDNLLDVEISELEIRSAVNAQNNNKSPGIELISLFKSHPIHVLYNIYKTGIQCIKYNNLYRPI